MKSGKIYGWDKNDWGKTVSVDKDLDDVNPAEYDALVLPGGQINPDKLRAEPKAIEIIRAFYSSGKTVAAICHAPWLLDRSGRDQGQEVHVLPLDQDRRDQCRRRNGATRRS